ncbi:MAG: cytidylate kinase-like family protein [Thermodesulfobacteriota bacterium]
MQIICISRGTMSGGKQLAEGLAKKLLYQCLSREDLIEAAIREGIQVGKIETALMKPGLFTERLALEREHYIAFTTAYLCDKVKDGPLVYHGRTGHLLLPGVNHVLRVRVVADWDYRIKAAMKQLNVDRVKAQRYLEAVDEDRRRWAHNLYGVSGDEAGQYDIVINLEQLSVDNAVAALTTISQLPDFQMTPASRRVMDNLNLGARVRLALARDERTGRTGFKVRADNGGVTVTYLPQDSKAAQFIQPVTAGVAGIKELQATMAATNLLWIQEEFKPQSDSFHQVVEIATKWNAAVELVRFESGDAVADSAEKSADPAPVEAAPRAYDGGIEDDVEEAAEGKAGGLAETLEELARLGRSGGGHQVAGGHEHLLKAVDRTAPYTLVVVGDVFLDKSHAVRTRLNRELRSYLSDHIRAPVVGVEDLKSQYLFTKKDALSALLYLGLTAIIYYLVFTHQEPLLNFFVGEEWKTKLMAAVGVFVCTPIVAFLYGNVAKSFLKLIKME